MCRDAAIGAIEEKRVQKVKLSVGDCGPATQEVGGGEDEANEAKQLKKIFPISLYNQTSYRTVLMCGTVNMPWLEAHYWQSSGLTFMESRTWKTITHQPGRHYLG